MTSAFPRIRFPTTGRFHADLKARVEEHFRRTGRAPQGGDSMRVKTAVLFAWLAGSYAIALFAHVNAWQAALLVVSIGLAMAGIGFCVQHDANHGGYARSPRTNRVLGFSVDLIGGSSYVWRQKHNILHHTYTNIAGLDDDLEAGPLLRLAPWQERRAFHRFQHLYVWLLYAVFPLRWWFIDDFRDVAIGRIGKQPFRRPRGWELVSTLAGKAAFYAWAFVVPALVHPTWKLIPLWLLGVGTVGLVIGVVFQLAHCAGEAEFHDGSELSHEGEMVDDWAVHQVKTTIDFARGNGILSWYLGGLNFQIEHHLFPRICHVHYSALASIVEETCREHGVRYRTVPTLRSALAANVRWLRRMGSGASA
jgi:linoleoyl-CoA desaturase